MVALLLALCSSAAWGVADFLAGLKSRTLPVPTVMLVAVVTGLALSAALVAVRAAGPPDLVFLGYGALSAVVGSIGLAAFYRGLAVGTMSVVAPIAATGAVVPVAFGLASGERPEIVQGVGAALAIAGVVLASREPAREASAVRDGDAEGVEARTAAGFDPRWYVTAGARARPRVARGAGLALIAAIGLGSFLVAIDAASEGDFGWAILANRVVSLGLIGGAAIALRSRLPANTRDALPAVAVGVLETIANVMIAIATTLGFVSLVGVLASLYPVATIALARIVLGERVARVQQAGTVVALVGVVLIAGGSG